MFEPVDFYYLAKHLHSSTGENPQATMRACIGRAYYAAFLVAREKAGLKTQKNSSIHTDVANYCETIDKDLHQNIKDLKKLRGLADYNLSKNFTSRDTEKAIAFSQIILETLGIALES